MKFLPYLSAARSSRTQSGSTAEILLAIWVAAFTSVFPVRLLADDAPQTLRQGLDEANQANLLVQRTIERLALGDAFDAKLRQRTWVQRHEVVGIGHYEQSGGGTGRYSLEMTIHDGDLRHTNQQISDGKLAWVRTHLGSTVTLRRIDLGRIDEFYRELARQGVLDSSPTRIAGSIVTSTEQVPPWMRVGGLVEIVEQIAADYDLRLSKGFVDQKAVWILRGVIKESAKNRMMDPAAGAVWSELCPHEVRMAIMAVGDDQGFGVGLPCRVEFWGQPPVEVSIETSPTTPVVDQTEQSTAGVTQPDKPRGNLISLLEIYSVRRIEPSPEVRFRFEREDRDVNFFNDTRHYLQRITHQHPELELP